MLLRNKFILTITLLPLFTQGSSRPPAHGHILFWAKVPAEEIYQKFTPDGTTPMWNGHPLVMSSRLEAVNERRDAIPAKIQASIAKEIELGLRLPAEQDPENPTVTTPEPTTLTISRKNNGDETLDPNLVAVLYALTGNPRCPGLTHLKSRI